MNSKYVVSLELAKKLKEAGMRQESEWYWFFRNRPDTWILVTKKYKEELSPEFEHLFVSAFHVGELAELLPWCIHRQSEMPFCLEIRKCIESADPTYEWTVRYIRGVNAAEQIPFTRENLAEAMGECLLFLKEKKYI